MLNNYGCIVDRECQCQPGIDTEAQMEGRTEVNNYGTITSRKCTGRVNRKIFRLPTLNNYGTFVLHKCCCDSVLLSIGNLNNYGTIVNCRSSSCPLNPTDSSSLPLLGDLSENVSMSATLGSATSREWPMPPFSSSDQTSVKPNLCTNHLNGAQKVTQGNPSFKPSGSYSSDYLKHFSPSATSTPKKPSRKRTITFSSPANSQKPPTMAKPSSPIRVVVKLCNAQLPIEPPVPVTPNNFSKEHKLGTLENSPKKEPQENPKFNVVVLSPNPQRAGSVKRSVWRVYKLENPQKRKQEWVSAPPPKQPRPDDSNKEEKQEVPSIFGKLLNYLKTPFDQGYKKLKYNSQNL